MSLWSPLIKICDTWWPANLIFADEYHDKHGTYCVTIRTIGEGTEGLVNYKGDDAREAKRALDSAAGLLPTGGRDEGRS